MEKIEKKKRLKNHIQKYDYFYCVSYLRLKYLTSSFDDNLYNL